MIVQLILLPCLLAVAAYAFAQRKRSLIVATAIFMLSTIGFVMVAAPEISTLIANWIGVGRGADLVLYIFVCLTLVAIFSLHLRMRKNFEIITILARNIALSNAKSPPTSKNKTP